MPFLTVPSYTSQLTELSLTSLIYKDGVKIPGPHSRVVQGDRDTQSRSSSIISLSVPVLSSLTWPTLRSTSQQHQMLLIASLSFCISRLVEHNLSSVTMDYTLLLNKKDHSKVNPLVLPS